MRTPDFIGAIRFRAEVTPPKRIGGDDDRGAGPASPPGKMVRMTADVRAADLLSRLVLGALLGARGFVPTVVLEWVGDDGEPAPPPRAALHQSRQRPRAWA